MWRPLQSRLFLSRNEPADQGFSSSTDHHRALLKRIVILDARVHGSNGRLGGRWPQVAEDLMHHSNRVYGIGLFNSSRKGYVLGTPKTARAVRDVPILDDGLFRDLGIYLRQHPHRDNLEAGPWPGKVPGHNKRSYEHTFDPKGFYRYTFKPAATRAGLDGLHFHELRHTFATLALESRALDMHQLSRAMGHAS